MITSFMAIGGLLLIGASIAVGGRARYVGLLGVVVLGASASMAVLGARHWDGCLRRTYIKHINPSDISKAKIDAALRKVAGEIDTSQTCPAAAPLGIRDPF